MPNITRSMFIMPMQTENILKVPLKSTKAKNFFS